MIIKLATICTVDCSTRLDTEIAIAIAKFRGNARFPSTTQHRQTETNFGSWMPIVLNIFDVAMLLLFLKSIGTQRLLLQQLHISAGGAAAAGTARRFTLSSVTLKMAQPQKKALVIIAPGSEEIEAVTPIDVLRRAGVHVYVAGLFDKSPVTCSRNVVLVPDGSLKDFTGDSENYDLVILPGGLKGAESFANSPEIGKLLKSQESSGGLIGAICAAPIALKAHGIAQGKQITSYPSVKDQIMSAGADYKYQEDRVVIDGNIITSRGPGTALEFALALTKALVGEEKAAEVGKGMLFVGST